MDPIEHFRLRQALAIFVAAPLTAAALHHLAQVYGGMTGEDLRAVSLMTAAALGLLLIAVLVREAKRHG